MAKCLACANILFQGKKKEKNANTNCIALMTKSLAGFLLKVPYHRLRLFNMMNQTN